MPHKKPFLILGFIPRDKTPQGWVRLSYVAKTDEGEVLCEVDEEDIKRCQLPSGELEKMAASKRVILFKEPVFGNGSRVLFTNRDSAVYLANVADPYLDGKKQKLYPVKS